MMMMMMMMMMMILMKLNASLQEKKADFINFSLVAVGVDCGTAVVLPVISSCGFMYSAQS